MQRAQEEQQRRCNQQYITSFGHRTPKSVRLRMCGFHETQMFGLFHEQESLEWWEHLGIRHDCKHLEPARSEWLVWGVVPDEAVQVTYLL